MLLARQEELVQDASRRILGSWGEGSCCTLKYQVLLGPSLGPLSGPESRVHLSPQTLGLAEPTHFQHTLGGGAQTWSPTALLGGDTATVSQPTAWSVLSSPLQRGAPTASASQCPGRALVGPARASGRKPPGMAHGEGQLPTEPGCLPRASLAAGVRLAAAP